MSNATKPAPSAAADLLAGKSQADVLALLAAGKVSLEQAQAFMAAAATSSPNKAGKRTEGCECTRQQFQASAKPIDVTLAGQPMVAEPKEFSTGSFGWYASGKARLKLADGTIVTCQVGLNLTVLRSKEAAQ